MCSWQGEETSRPGSKTSRMPVVALGWVHFPFRFAPWVGPFPFLFCLLIRLVIPPLISASPGHSPSCLPTNSLSLLAEHWPSSAKNQPGKYYLCLRLAGVCTLGMKATVMGPTLSESGIQCKQMTIFVIVV